MRELLAAVAVLLALLAACGGNDDGGAADSPTLTGAASVAGSPTGGMRLGVSSNVLTEEGSIPTAYTCDGENTSPDVQWTGAPDGARSFTVLMDDPDAGGFVHWLVYNIPGSAIGLPGGVTDEETLADGARQGTNSRGDTGYTGPCPPSGTHTYVITVYALDVALDIQPGAEALEVITAMEGHILATGRLTATYGR
jgi:Raf kinase inhibitor-like YbhB/YbcL family protein